MAGKAGALTALFRSAKIDCTAQMVFNKPAFKKERGIRLGVGLMIRGASPGTIGEKHGMVSGQKRMRAMCEKENEGLTKGETKS